MQHHLSHLQQALVHHHSQNDPEVSKRRNKNNTLKKAVLIQEHKLNIIQHYDSHGNFTDAVPYLGK